MKKNLSNILYRTYIYIYIIYIIYIIIYNNIYIYNNSNYKDNWFSSRVGLVLIIKEIFCFTTSLKYFEVFPNNLRITSKHITNAERVPLISFPVFTKVLVCCAFYFDFITKIVSETFCCFENDFRLAKIWNFYFLGFVSSVLIIVGTFRK